MAYTLSTYYGQYFLNDFTRMRNVERAMPERFAAFDVEMVPSAHKVYVSGKLGGKRSWRVTEPHTVSFGRCNALGLSAADVLPLVLGHKGKYL